MFQGEKVLEDKQVTLISSYMRSKALTQIKPFVLQFYQDKAPNKVDKQIKNFSLFKEKIKPVFRVSNKPTIA